MLFSCKIAHNRRKAKEGFQSEVEVDGKTKENWQKLTATTNPSAKLAAFSDRGFEDGDEQDYRHDDHLRL